MEVVTVETSNPEHPSNNKDLSYQSFREGLTHHDEQKQGICDKSVDSKHGYHNSTYKLASSTEGWCTNSKHNAQDCIALAITNDQFRILGKKNTSIQSPTSVGFDILFTFKKSNHKRALLVLVTSNGSQRTKSFNLQVNFFLYSYRSEGNLLLEIAQIPETVR